jgi:hypothetical protein
MSAKVIWGLALSGTEILGPAKAYGLSASVNIGHLLIYAGM